VTISRLHRWTRRLVAVLLIGVLGWGAFIYFKGRPQDLPWTPLALDQPVGLFTGRKLTALTQDRPMCMQLLRGAGLDFKEVPANENAQCPVADAVRLAPDQAMLSLKPAGTSPSCPVVAALAMWKWQVVQPAAQRIFGQSVRRIDHFGSFACRRIYGREGASWSEHATADAIDVSGFTLEDGRRIDVASDWGDADAKGLFLRDVRDGACRLFSTVLSPDYNAQHRDHFHLDLAERGEMGWRGCR
jgi:hypothetical protein